MGLTRRIIPCLDVDKGRVVKGVKLADCKDVADPVEVGRTYEAQGADELVFLDITASAERRSLMAQALERMAGELFIPVTVGGGIRSLQDIRWMLNAGADRVALNTAAVLNEELVQGAAQRHGPQCIVVAIDARRVSRNGEAPRWEVCTHGGRKLTGVDVLDWAQRVEQDGAGEILLTSMDNDGTRDGYDIELTRAVCEAVNLPVVASGGAGSVEHLYAGIVEGLADAVIGSTLFHHGDVTVAQAKEYLSGRGLPIRPVS